MKVSELTGPRLDYWVAKAAGMECVLENWTTVQMEPAACWLLRDGKPDFENGPFCPSSSWKDAGPIIEREEIDIGSPGRRVHRNGGPNAGWGRSGVWGACTWTNGARGRRSFGWDEKSPLVAAMRCYVEHKLGEEVQA